jgi:hypothetical protein
MAEDIRVEGEVHLDKHPTILAGGLFCSVCNEWTAVGLFSRSSWLRVITESERELGLSLEYLGEAARGNSVQVASACCHLRCGPCGEIEEIVRVNVSRRAALCGVCSVCAHPLLEDPPDVQYLRNTRCRPHKTFLSTLFGWEAADVVACIITSMPRFIEQRY